LSPGTAFNKENVQELHDNLQECTQKHRFEAKNIYHMDETNLTTVHKPPMIITNKK
jgi:hypothetical protein